MPARKTPGKAPSLVENLRDATRLGAGSAEAYARLRSWLER
jgi:hypothetical protein